MTEFVDQDGRKYIGDSVFGRLAREDKFPIYLPDDHTAELPSGIGDVNSTERGSGARYNTGKPALELIPVRQWLTMWRSDLDPDIAEACNWLARFQEGDHTAIERAMQAAREHTADAARVLDYGRKKYAEWNWAKGMPWSVCFGCALRHAQEIAVRGVESVDDESEQTHAGHFLCNLIFLAHYALTYPEGDDRPPRECFTSVGDEEYGLEE